MITFALVINGERVAIAGIPGDGVISAIVTSHIAPDGERKLEVTLGGLDVSARPGTHHRWAERALAIGDRIEIVVAEGDAIDVPRESYESSPPEREAAPSIDELRTIVANVESRVARMERNVATATGESFSFASNVRFEVAREDTPVLRAGLPDNGVLTLIVHARVRSSEELDLRLEVGGLTDDDRHVRWLDAALSVPCSVRIVVAGGGDVDPPAARSDQPPWSDQELTGVRAHLARLRRELEETERS